MRLTFLGASRQVTGSCYQLEAGGLTLLIDRGMFQERKFQHRNWEPLPTDTAKIDAVLLTHAHLDHCGLLPRLVRNGFNGTIYATEPTVELAQIVMDDSARIQLEDVKYKRKRHRKQNRKSPHPYQPLYTPEDAAAAGKLLRGVNFNTTVRLNDRVRVKFVEAGHILGSAMLVIDAEENGATKRIVFSGDIGQWDMPIVGNPTLIDRADVVVMESTYGDKNHERADQIEDQLAEAVNDAVQAGGMIVTPTFAIERAQELLLHLTQLIDAKRIPRIPVFLDSPMAINATAVFRKHRDFMDAQTQRLLISDRLEDEWKLVKLTRTAEQSIAINDIKGPGIVLAGSGMCTGGRVKHHLRQRITHPRNTVMFVGYQAQGTLGRQILDGSPSVRMFGVQHEVRAKIKRIDGLSAHAGQSDLLKWLDGFNGSPRQVFLTHGEEDAAIGLGKLIREMKGLNVRVPEFQETAELS